MSSLSIPLNLNPALHPDLPRYLPQDVPDHLFTHNELKQMGLVPTQEFEAYVLYPEQKREYKLYNVNDARKSKRQSGISIIPKDYIVQEVLKRRKHAIEVREEQGM